jgi:hypothetical protein
MSYTLAVGTKAYIASTYGSSKTMSALSNATSAVATLESSHGVIVGDFVEISSGWGEADDRIAKATVVSTNDVTLGNIDTSSTTNFPVGTGTGSVREITAWTEVTQITPDYVVQGGEQEYADISTLDQRLRKRLPTRRGAIGVELETYFDPTLSWWSTVKSAADGATPVAVKFVYPNGTVIVANAYWSLQEVPTVGDNTLRAKINIDFCATPTTYTS